MDVAAGRAELTQKALHRQYGVAVRLGPNLISLSDPALIKKIYNTKGDYIKVIPVRGLINCRLIADAE